LLLALDVGNTNITLGLFDGSRLRAKGRLVTSARGLPRSLAAFVRRHKARVDDVVYGSVVPSVDGALEKACGTAFRKKPLRVDPSTRLGMRLRVKTPRQVGADRILNALAAFELARGAAVVIDFGTATTFDCVSPRGDYLGGAILPGPNMAARALHEFTAKLPLVPVARPRRAIGKDTVECIQGGLYFGYLGMIEKVLSLTLSELGGKPAVIATGGLSALFRGGLARGIRVEPDLTLNGLRIAHARMRGQ